MPADDIHALPPIEAILLPGQKKKGYPLTRTLRSVKRLEGLIAGAKTTGKAVLFRGAISLDHLNRLVSDFRNAEKALVAGRSGSRTTGEGLRDNTAAGEEFVAGVLVLVDSLYDRDIDGRGVFYPTERGTQPLPVRVAAAIAGIEADGKRDDPLLPSAKELPLMDLVAAQKLLAELTAEEQSAAGHQLDAAGAMRQRNAVGDTIRAKVIKVEQFVRQLHKDEPEMLRHYGLLPLRHQLIRKAKKVVAKAAKAKGGK